MAAMKFWALRNPKERWLIDLILLSISSTAPWPGLGPGEDSIEVGAEHAHEFLERLQFRAHSRIHPFTEMLPGAPRLLVAPEELEGFLSGAFAAWVRTRLAYAAHMNMHTIRRVRQRRRPISSVKNSHCLFGPILSDPQQDLPLHVV